MPIQIFMENGTINPVWQDEIRRIERSMERIIRQTSGEYPVDRLWTSQLHALEAFINGSTSRHHPPQILTPYLNFIHSVDIRSGDAEKLRSYLCMIIVSCFSEMRLRAQLEIIKKNHLGVDHGSQ